MVMHGNMDCRILRMKMFTNRGIDSFKQRNQDGNKSANHAEQYKITDHSWQGLFTCIMIMEVIVRTYVQYSF